MITAQTFTKLLEQYGMTHYYGVPDSTLKHLCSYVADTLPTDNHLICVNEGTAVATGIGYYLGTGNIPVLYMQNSGFGNAVNPLTSLAAAEVYSIPALLLIGWRGEPGKQDEPQHALMGTISPELSNVLKIPYSIVDGDTNVQDVLSTATAFMKEKKSPYALFIKKGTFETVQSRKSNQQSFPLTREGVVRELAKVTTDKSVIVSTTGMASRELYESLDSNVNSRGAEFLTVGGMGCASSIALGLAMSRKNRQVYCLDGDGAVLMHMGAMATIGTTKPANYTHIVVNNGEHGSTGGQPNVARQVDLCAIATNCGYPKVERITEQSRLKEVLQSSTDTLRFIEVMVNNSYRSELGRPKSSPIENKYSFMLQMGV